LKNNFRDRFRILKARMMKWAEEKKYQTSKNSDFIIPDHPDRNKSWKEDLKLIIKFENHMELTRVQKLFLNQLWRMYKV
tara:strand:- start:168 stop:404 length:237 start_codon:yes stop_codon:yes gene_type:complete